MRFLVFTVPALCAAAAVPKTCEKVPKRVEWRQMDESARQQYTYAVLCLSTKPSSIGLNSTLYDDFPYVHSKLDTKTHSVASFLPWHRYFVHVYKGALNEGGYKGVMPYWDWTLDAEDVPKSGVWDAKTGFGGNGSPDKTELMDGGKSIGKCVADGPFKDFHPVYFEAVKKVQDVKSYDEYRQKLEAGPHGAVHAGMGGDMVPNTSPNDPIFFLHHTQIDRLWWMWQEQNPKTRHTEFAGIKTQDHFDGTTPLPASLNDILLMEGMADDLKVKDLMSTKSSLLCYTY